MKLCLPDRIKINFTKLLISYSAGLIIFTFIPLGLYISAVFAADVIDNHLYFWATLYIPLFLNAFLKGYFPSHAILYIFWFLPIFGIFYRIGFIPLFLEGVMSKYEISRINSTLVVINASLTFGIIGFIKEEILDIKMKNCVFYKIRNGYYNEVKK